MKRKMGLAAVIKFIGIAALEARRTANAVVINPMRIHNRRASRQVCRCC